MLNPRNNPTLLLIISYSVRRLPYIVRSAYAGFQQTSVTLEEASANLGASPFRTLRRITLPLVMANLIAGTILTFSFAMLEVSDGLILAMREQYLPDHEDDLPADGPDRTQRAQRRLRPGRGGHAQSWTASLLVAGLILGAQDGATLSALNRIDQLLPESNDKNPP